MVVACVLKYFAFNELNFFQTDVKSAFLNGCIIEEVYVNNIRALKIKIFKLCLLIEKILYGSKQAPRAWYERLNKFFIDSGLNMDKVDKPFIKRKETTCSLFKFTLMKSFLVLLMSIFVKNLLH